MSNTDPTTKKVEPFMPTAELSDDMLVMTRDGQFVRWDEAKRMIAAADAPTTRDHAERSPSIAEVVEGEVRAHVSADHAELERLAEAATPGPWKSIIDDTGGERSGWPLCIVPENGDDRSVVRTGGMWPYEWDAKVSQHEAVSTAAFIAAANPATVLALLSEIAALRKALELAAKRFEALRDLTDHVPHRIACSTWADEARQANQGADKL